MTNYNITYYYSLFEFATKGNDLYKDQVEMSCYDLDEIFSLKLGWELSSDLMTILRKAEVKDLWKNYILAKNLNEFVTMSENEYTSEELTSQETFNKVFGEFARLFLAVLKETAPRYLTLIEIYQTNERNLLNKIKNESLTIYNDTPQSKDDFNQNQFASNISKYEGGTDGGTLMSRLEEIRRNWHNIIEEWSTNFESLFMEDL